MCDTPDLKQPYHLYTNASGVGLGAVLKQEQEGEIKPLVSTHINSERHCSIIELETYAIVKAFLQFAAYLRGAQVTIHTDHRALEFLQKMKNSSPKLMRWAMVVQPYNYVIEHLPGHLDLGQRPANEWTLHWRPIKGLEMLGPGLAQKHLERASRIQAHL